MKLRQWKRTAAIGLSAVIAVTSLSGCRFGFASDPDDESDTVKEEPIDTSVDTFAYDESLKGTEITLLNSKAEIQVALEKMSKIFEEKAGVHIEVMPVTEGDSPYTKVVSMYNSGNAPTMAILDTTDVKALADEKALVLDEEDWVKEAGNYATEIHGHIYSLPLCVEGKGIIYNKKVIEETLGRDFDPDEINTLDGFKALLAEMRDAGMEKPVSLAKEDWSLGAHHLQYLYETYDGTSDGAAKAVEDLENGQLKVKDYDRVSQLLDLFSTRVDVVQQDICLLLQDANVRALLQSPAENWDTQKLPHDKALMNTTFDYVLNEKIWNMSMKESTIISSIIWSTLIRRHRMATSALMLRSSASSVKRYFLCCPRSDSSRI